MFHSYGVDSLSHPSFNVNDGMQRNTVQTTYTSVQGNGKVRLQMFFKITIYSTTQLREDRRLQSDR